MRLGPTSPEDIIIASARGRRRFFGGRGISPWPQRRPPGPCPDGYNPLVKFVVKKLGLATIVLAASAASCTVMRVNGENEPTRVESKGLVKGHVAFGMREDDQIVQASLLKGSSRGSLLEFGLWKLFRVEVGLAGVAVGVGPVDTALGVGLYKPEVPDIETSDPAPLPPEPIPADDVEDFTPPVTEPVVEEEPPPAPGRQLPPDADAALAEYQVSLGDEAFRDERYDDAVDAYLRAIMCVPDDATTYLVLADALFATADYHYAAYTIQKALRLDPTLAKAGTDKRTFYRDQKTFDAQLQRLRDYLAERPYDAAAHFVLGYNLVFSGRAAEVAAEFETVTSIEPGHAGAAAFLGR